MRSIGLALVFALIPAIGCGDDIKFPDEIDPTVTDPALNGVNPPRGFTNRTIEVQISGDGTEFSDSAQVTFGTGINIDEVTLSSPSLLIAKITITGGATLGDHDVIVTDTDSTLTLSKAFEVRDPVELQTVGALLQGGFANLRLINRDTENPWLGDITIGGAAGVGFQINTPGGLTTIDLTSEFTIESFVSFDTDAVSGKIIVTDTQGDRVLTYQSNELSVTARAATPLGVGTKGNQGAFFVNGATFSGTSQLFSFSTSALISASASPSDSKNDPDAAPFIIFLPNGKWAQDRGFVFTSDLHPAIDPMFILVLDDNGVNGYNFDLVVDIDTPLPSPTRLAEVEPNDVTPQTTTGDVIVFTATLDDFAQVDFEFDNLTVTLVAGQTLRVITTSGNFEGTDSLIDIIDPDGLLVDESSDTGNGEELLITALIPGDYVVSISTSLSTLSFGDPYEAIILIGPPPAT